ncbi:hypothetical protein [Clostridium ganghwense]|uniref:DUF4325 domain-containing protein n=1 Tax=Clostridium ganghwense TaxID=312089 RepID=A0ABT4CLV4_9CLOT|nr:hypothetical protein [Clostridium ganghwense]MCY6370030.1 hypothetical protein [Clostridium ganghwense]
MKEININDFLGEEIKYEDEVLLREFVEDNIDESIIIDFQNRKDIPITLFSSLLTEMMCKKGRDYIASHLTVKNLPNIKAFKRVINGTSCNK